MNLRDEYRKETGKQFNIGITEEGMFTDDYVVWLELKVSELRKENEKRM